jgi:hypothetical protein
LSSCPFQQRCTIAATGQRMNVWTHSLPGRREGHPGGFLPVFSEPSPMLVARRRQTLDFRNVIDWWWAYDETDDGWVLPIAEFFGGRRQQIWRFVSIPNTHIIRFCWQQTRSISRSFPLQKTKADEEPPRISIEQYTYNKSQSYSQWLPLSSCWSEWRGPRRPSRRIGWAWQLGRCLYSPKGRYLRYYPPQMWKCNQMRAQGSHQWIHMLWESSWSSSSELQMRCSFHCPSGLCWPTSMTNTDKGLFENKVLLKFWDKTMILKNTMLFLYHGLSDTMIFCSIWNSTPP